MAISTAAVWSSRPDDVVAWPAKCTATLEMRSPANDSAENGTTCLPIETFPPRDQTQRRLSSNDGRVPTAVATRLDSTLVRAKAPTKTPSTVRLVAVEITDTEAYFTRRRSSGRCLRKTLAVMRPDLPRCLGANWERARRVLGNGAARLHPGSNLRYSRARGRTSPRKASTWVLAPAKAFALLASACRGVGAPGWLGACHE